MVCWWTYCWCWNQRKVWGSCKYLFINLLFNSNGSQLSITLFIFPFVLTLIAQQIIFFFSYFLLNYFILLFQSWKWSNQTIFYLSYIYILTFPHLYQIMQECFPFLFYQVLKARNGELSSWESLEDGKKSALAFIILIDQFCRNIYRVISLGLYSHWFCHWVTEMKCNKVFPLHLLLFLIFLLQKIKEVKLHFLIFPSLFHRSYFKILSLVMKQKKCSVQQTLSFFFCIVNFFLSI